MSPAPSFRFLQLPDDLTKREAEYCIQLTKNLAGKYDYRKACEIAENLAQNFLDARAASHKGPELNLIITALPIGVTSFSLNSTTGEMTISLSEGIENGDLQILNTVLKPENTEISRDRQTVSLSWE